MVGFAPGCGDGAVGEGAALVAGDDGFADVGREDPGGAADVQHAAVAAEQDGDDVRVAGDLADDRGVERALERGGAAAEAGAGGRFAVEVFEALQEVAVIDGHHHLRPEATVRGQLAGGQGHCAGADEPVEQFLRPGAWVQVGAGAGAGGVGLEARVGGGVHDGGEGFELVRGGEDFQMMQAAAGFADERSLAVAQFFLAGFGSVLVDGIDPAFGHPGDEIGIALHRSVGE
ncbi:hypothetical protein GCM10017710_20760 [Arthrobacter ramosus]